MLNESKGNRLLILILTSTVIFGGAMIYWFSIRPLLAQKPAVINQTSKTKPASASPQAKGNKSFEQVITKLTTSQKIIDYLNKNFEMEEREQTVPLKPKEFFETKKGSSWDFAVFTSYVLWKNNYEASIIRYKYDKNRVNAVVVFRDKDIPKTIIFTPQGASMYPHGWSFEAMFQKEEKRLGAKITDYAVSYWTDKGALWPEKWEKRKS